jgi:ABC-2 type transport system permease protein
VSTTLTGAVTTSRRRAAPRPGPWRDLTGTGRLLRFALRRDRVRIAVWTTVLSALALTSAISVRSLYSTPEQLATYARLVQDNAAVVVQSGPGYGLEDPTVGAVLMNELSIWTIVVVAIMSILLVTRHGRAEEESNRAELLRATPIGRRAAGTATMAACFVSNAVVAAALSAGLVLVGFDATGAVAFGAALVGAGMTFGAVSLVTGQITASARAASGLALVTLIGAFILRAVGDVGDGRLSWLSPVGWAQAVRPFAGERWWVLAFPALATTALLAAAAVLAARRDFGAGLVPDQEGAPAAGWSLAGPVGLAWRLHRGALAGWAVGIGVLGAFYGVVADQAEQMLADNPELEQFFTVTGTSSITDLFLGTATLMVGLLAGGYVTGAVLRLHGEEEAGRVEAVLAGAVSRWHWAAGHLAVAGAGAVALLAVGGVGTGLGAAVSMGEPERVTAMLAAALTMAPGVAVLAAGTFCVWAITPRWVLLSWVGVAVAVVVAFFAEVLELPQPARDLSPFEHLGAPPAEAVTVTAVVVLTAIAVGLVAVGAAAFRRRDVRS